MRRLNQNYTVQHVHGEIKADNDNGNDGSNREQRFATLI